MRLRQAVKILKHILGSPVYSQKAKVSEVEHRLHTYEKAWTVCYKLKKRKNGYLRIQ